MLGIKDGQILPLFPHLSTRKGGAAAYKRPAHCSKLQTVLWEGPGVRLSQEAGEVWPHTEIQWML